MKAILALACIVLSASALWTGKFEAVPEKIEGQYIVVFKKGAHTTDRDAHFQAFANNMTVIAKHSIGTFQGYSARIHPSLVSAVEKHGAVAYVEQDAYATIQQATCAVQNNLPAGLWGLVRIHQRDLNLSPPMTYTYHQVTRNEVRAYILDTGILTTHVDFASGRATAPREANFVDAIDVDQNGHGTHVASTVAGNQYGVSKTAVLIGVKVLGKNGSGSWTGVIQGVQWATQDAAKYRGTDPGIGNMSLGGGRNQALNDAVDASSAQGFAWVVASGNSNADACNSSPASAPTALCVGSTANTDQRSTFSNWGRCQDVWAPGQNVLGAWMTSNTATNTISGTSMASPHACGVASNILASAPASPPMTPAHLFDLVKAQGTANVVRDGKEANGTPNIMVYSRCSNANE
jgi:subtilisin family serine protease